MENTFIYVISFYAICATIVIFFLKGYGFKPSTLNLPFFGFSVDRFSDITPYIRFDNVSRAAISFDNDKRNYHFLNGNPQLMIHVGWSLICSSYVAEYGSLPNNESLNENVQKIGPQNCEYIRQFRDFAESASKHKKVNLDDAKDYLGRCPSMAQRIINESEFDIDYFIQNFAEHLKVESPHFPRPTYNL